jgi:hypothetical protein
MATDHAKRQLKSMAAKNKYWNYQDKPYRGFKITREALNERVEEFKLRKGK